MIMCVEQIRREGKKDEKNMILPHLVKLKIDKGKGG